MAVFDYTPTPILPMPYWRWNRVLPAVYDDSVSQYEMLCKFGNRINEIIEKSNSIGDAINELGKVVASLFENGSVAGVPDVTELGIISDFRFGMRPPADFDINNFLSIAEHDLSVFAQHAWSYEANQGTTIPLFTDDSDYTVTNNQGEVTSCSTFVCDCLYKAGYTDLAGVSHYMTQPDNYLRTYLIGKGWTIIDSIDDLQAGDIVATSWRRDSNALFYPGHTFIYGRNGYKYDAGSQNLIQSGLPSILNWNTGYDQLYRTFTTGYYHAKGTLNMGYSDDDSDLLDWYGLVITVIDYVENIERDGYHTIQIFWNGRRTVIRQTVDNGINWGIWADNRMQQSGFAVFNPSNAGTLQVNTQNKLAFQNVANANNDVFTLNNDGSVTIKVTGLYDVSFVVQHTIAASQADIDASNSAYLTANIFSYDANDSNEYTQLSVTQPYTHKRSTIIGHRIMRLFRNQRIRLGVYVPIVLGEAVPTIFTGLAQTHLAIELIG